MVKKIENLYFTFDQLAAHWAIPIEDVMQLAFTNQLKIIAQADWEYPRPQIIQRGAHTPINFEEVANILYVKEPFTLIGFAVETQNGILRGDQCNITFYPGISRLIVDATEVKRFEGEQSQARKTRTVKPIKTKIKAAGTTNAKRNEIAQRWLNTEKPDLKKYKRNKQIIDALVEFCEEGKKSLFLSGGKNWLVRDNSVIPKSKDR